MKDTTIYLKIFQNFVKNAFLMLMLTPNLLLGQNTPSTKKTDEITHGPMLGNITNGSVRIWARTKQPNTFRVIYSTSPDLTSAKSSREVKTTWENDATGWIELTGLESNTKYYYALEINGNIADTRVNNNFNSFKTLPDKSDFAHQELNPNGLFNFSFEIGTGNSQGYKQNLPPTYATMLNKLKDDIYFQIQNGDWIYEIGREKTTEAWAKENQVKDIPELISQAKGITGVWENYKIYLDNSKHLADFYKEVPQFVTFDDHEILNDVIGSGEVGLHLDARNKPWQEKLNDWNHEKDVERAVFRDPAIQAWEDYIGWSNPDIGIKQAIHFGTTQLKSSQNILTDDKADFTKLDLDKVTNLHVLWGFGNTGVYQITKVLGPHQIEVSPAFRVSEKATYSIGTKHYSKLQVANTEFYILDTRSNRTLHDKSNPNDPNTSMLGQTQKKWLFENLKNSKADIIFLVSTVNLAVPHDNGAWYGKGTGSPRKDDGWTAHLHERAQLLSLLDSLNKTVFVLTGDLHKSFVARVAPGIYDIASGPHTSGNHRLGDSGGSPPSGWYNSGDRLVNVIWSSNQYRNDSKREGVSWPIYTVIRVNNIYTVPDKDGKDLPIAYPEPQVIIEFRDGHTGQLSFAYAVSTSEAKPVPVAVPLEKVKVFGGISDLK
ncbi:MAG: alkaline phosphatase D family protein [Microscillaceae bacterium]|nr:alkaline phosphatase D family protein [Microscillaceae bacterium]